MIKLQYWKYISLFMIILGLAGIQNLFIAKFDLSILRDGTFWSNTTTTTAIYYLTIILVVLMKAEKAETSDEDILSDKAIINEFSLNDMDPTFQEFNDLETLNNKADAWKEHINNKISKLDNKASYLDRIAWRNGDKGNKYVQKRNELLQLVDDEYVKDNIYYLKVSKRKYEVINDSTVIVGYTSKNNFKFKRQNDVWKITKDTAPKFIVGTIYSVVLSSFALTFKEFDLETLYQIGVKLATIILNGIWATSYAPKFITEQIRVPLKNAIQHIKKYMIWKKNRKGVNQVETNNLPN